jgi:hypothetical protein
MTRQLSPLLEEELRDSAEWRTLEAEAKRRGLPTARALRDWCKRHQVPYVRDGKNNWVKPRDIDAAISRRANARDEIDIDTEEIALALVATRARR